MSAVTFDLRGIESDNLLAILSLVGLARLLECSHPEWGTQISWSGPPWFPRLHIDANISQETLLRAIPESFQLVAPSFAFDAQNIKEITAEDYRVYEETTRKDANSAEAKLRFELLAALGTNSRLPKNLLTPLEPSPLCAIHGQGHQDFLRYLREIAAFCTDPANAQTVTDDLRAMLFSPWNYERAKTISDVCRYSFRWDPRDDRRHAYQFYDPTDAREGTWIVRGTAYLAIVGFSQFPTVPRGRGGNTLGFSRGVGGARTLSWPIWRGSVSLRVLRRLLAHQLLDTNSKVKRGDLDRLGIIEVMRIERINNGKFLNFTRAKPTLGAV